MRGFRRAALGALVVGLLIGAGVPANAEPAAAAAYGAECTFAAGDQVYQRSHGVLALGHHQRSVPVGQYCQVGETELHFQTDGNLVVYDHLDVPLWASNTCCSITNTLEVQDDGNVVVYRGNTPLWESNTDH